MENPEAHIGDLVEGVLEKKKKEGRDYIFAQKNSKTTSYTDDDNDVLTHHSRAERGAAYLVEIEERRCGKESCEFSVYRMDEPMHIEEVMKVAEGETKNGSDASPSKLFSRFVGARDIKTELENYAKEHDGGRR